MTQVSKHANKQFHATMAAKDCQGKLTSEEAACADCVLESSTAQTVKRERVVLLCRCKVPGVCRVPTTQYGY